jgi:GT2 family glycosyltransferase
MKKIGAVILNYKTYDDAIECAKSILGQTYKNFAIVIVENGSGNESYEVIKNNFNNNENIHIIKSNINLGFAKGNNLGINYAKKELECDYVFVVNSDCIVESNLFEQIISTDVDGVGVISPIVHYLNGKFQPPAVATDNLSKKILKTYIDILITYMLHLPGVFYLYKKYKLIKGKNKSIYSKKDSSIEWKTYTLQGPAYFLTPNFFKYYTQLYPKTFLYWEEINLLWYLKKVGLKSKVVVTSPVVHKVSQSTKVLFNNADWFKKKISFSLKSMIVSTPLFFMSYKTIKKKFN